MNCNVIQDLMVLYADDCCSEESKAIVEEHIKSCDKCKKAFEEITSAPLITEQKTKAKAFSKINGWKASVLQSVLLFVSFALINFGVAREAATPSGNTNGLWAVAVIVPATGFMMSLANWYFVRAYPSRKSFSDCSLLATVAFMVIGYIWAVLHYRNVSADLFNGSVLSIGLLITGIVLSIAFCVISKLLSDQYAKMIGKE